MPPQLEKAKIKSIKPDKPAFDVLFNPSTYTVSHSNSFSKQGVPGQEEEILEFGYGESATLTMDLFFDTYDPQANDDRAKKNQDVRNYTRQLTDLLKVDSDKHEPPICQFSWGSFVFDGVLTSVQLTYTLFLPSGVPVRAKAAVTFNSYYDGQEQAGRLQSANFVKQHTVRRGDTLTSIAAARYDDPTKWRTIALANDIDNPLALEPGRVLVIPAIE